MNKNYLIMLVFFCSGCVAPRYAYHSMYSLDQCKEALSREAVAEMLVADGFLKASEPKGSYDVFHKPEIEKSRFLAVEPFVDKAGEIAVATCSSPSKPAVLIEEWKSCENEKYCTKNQQSQIQQLIEKKWGCHVEAKTGSSLVWKLEERQDWTAQRCATIVSELNF